MFQNQSATDQPLEHNSYQGRPLSDRTLVRDGFMRLCTPLRLTSMLLLLKIESLVANWTAGAPAVTIYLSVLLLFSRSNLFGTVTSNTQTLYSSKMLSVMHNKRKRDFEHGELLQSAAYTLFTLRVDPSCGSWVEHKEAWDGNDLKYSPLSSDSKPSHVSSSTVSFSAGDVVVVNGCTEGRAKMYNGHRGRVVSHRSKSPWFVIAFDDDSTVPVRSQCLQHTQKDR